ncbi:carbamoyltransferase HypF [Nitrosomonas sp.]|uniref:Kae1-like domain-containing protein n=1 Tax=Nitrosomonas sp. TaxID=42353 RepID=UPI001D625823|nr:carbamoyltransferase HypF [Nitrosomonas sp.]MBX3616797.1 carbamoyltransferase HypF [Nitrosomonas sp.]
MNQSEDIAIPLPDADQSILACGAWLKNTVCLTQHRAAYVSPLIGDLSTAEARAQLDHAVERMLHAYSKPPDVVAHDLHPDFYSTQFAQAFAEQFQVPILPVQHHHAHIAAICAEHQINQPVLGLALDGVGFGTDNLPWGGELLWVDGAQFERFGHLSPLALPGGDRAALEPWRMAAAVLARLNRHDEIVPRYAGQPAAATVTSMLMKNFNCPQTSSMGRLFDAAAGLLGINLIQTHEAQAAMQLQQLAESYGPTPPLTEGYRFTMENELDFSPILSALVDCFDIHSDAAFAAAIFHATLIDGLIEWVKRAAQHYQISTLALGGGCFHNTVLRHGLTRQLAAIGFKLLLPRQLPPDDRAISLGQAWVALQSKWL